MMVGAAQLPSIIRRSYRRSLIDRSDTRWLSRRRRWASQHGENGGDRTAAAESRTVRDVVTPDVGTEMPKDVLVATHGWRAGSAYSRVKSSVQISAPSGPVARWVFPFVCVTDSNRHWTQVLSLSKTAAIEAARTVHSEAGDTHPRVTGGAVSRTNGADEVT